MSETNRFSAQISKRSLRVERELFPHYVRIFVEREDVPALKTIAADFNEGRITFEEVKSLLNHPDISELGNNTIEKLKVEEVFGIATFTVILKEWPTIIL